LVPANIDTGPVLLKYQEQLRKVAKAAHPGAFGLAAGNIDADTADKFFSAFSKRVKGEGFTDNLKEYVGIGGWIDGCDFEVEVSSELKQAPKVFIPASFQSSLIYPTNPPLKLKYNVPYLIHASKEKTYLAADTSGSYIGTFFGYMYYARKSAASKFMFRKVGARESKGDIDQGAEVELTLCDDSGKAIGVVQRFKDDYATLLVSKYGVEDDLTTTNNSKLEYIKD
jgi:hypothetical protein